MTIILRLTKGSELTHAELDGNFTDLDGRVDALEADGSGGAAGAILQVVSVSKKDVFSMSSPTFTDVPGLQLTITPSSTSSKIILIANVVAITSPIPTIGYIRLERVGAPYIAAGDGAGSRLRISAMLRGNTDGNYTLAQPLQAVDSPSSSAPVTYKITVASETGTTLKVNTSANDLDHAIAGFRMSSTLTAFEVA